MNYDQNMRLTQDGEGIQMMLVTGGSGFLRRAVCAELLARGRSVAAWCERRARSHRAPHGLLAT